MNRFWQLTSPAYSRKAYSQKAGKPAVLLLCLTSLLMFFALTGCGFGEDETVWDAEPLMLAEDCFEDELYDEASGLCYDPALCDTPEACYEDEGIFRTIFDLFGGMGTSFSGPDFESLDAAGSDALIRYAVDGDRIVAPEHFDPEGTLSIDVYSLPELEEIQADAQTHELLWRYFTDMIPPQERAMLTGYVIFTDGLEETLAAVAPDPDDPAFWLLAVDPIDAANVPELTYTLIHEFGHLLTLQVDQVPPNAELAAAQYNLDDPGLYDKLYEEAETVCPTYFPGEGCSLPDSYINQFFQRFWIDLYPEWEAMQWMEDDEAYYEAVDAFYNRYADQFVTDYAATNPGEDIAESWTEFVLSPKPEGATIAEEKMLFFYNYPALITLRSLILNGVRETLAAE